jgi:hypothetical protein
MTLIQENYFGSVKELVCYTLAEMNLTLTYFTESTQEREPNNDSSEFCFFPEVAF